MKYLRSYPLLLFILLTLPLSAQQAKACWSSETANDTTNVERYDDPNLEPLVSSLSTIPFFHHTQPKLWYTWQEAGQKLKYYVWEKGKGKREVANTKDFDSYKYPRINPYGTSPDSLYRLSEDSLHNLRVENLKTKRIQTLTHDGAERYTFEILDCNWLDKGYFIIPRKDRRHVRQFSIIYSLNMPPKAYNYDYELPGDSMIATTSYYVGNVYTGNLTKVNLTKWKGQDLEFQPADGVKDRIFVWRKKRTRDIANLCTIDTLGQVKNILTEVSKPRIDPDMFACKILNKGKDIILWSDRSGWGHYYHYSGKGKLLNAITQGNWTAGRIVSVDEKRHILYFLGYGHEPGRNPNYSFAYKINWNGKHLKLLTPENANHNISVGYNHDLIVDTYSRVDLPPTVVVRDSNGKLLDILAKSNISKLTAYGWKAPQQITVTAADGKTRLYGLMWKPYDFDATRKYPVISQVYPGPFTETVWNDFTVFDRYHNAALAQHGFIVVVFGHRGSSPYRSKAYNVYGYGNLRDYPLADDKAGLEDLARQYPFIDIHRVGIVGHSGGGMMAAAAIMTYPDFYKAAVASSGNYDNRIYNRNWGENYQGLNSDGTFTVKTNAQLAKNLKGHLLLVTGDADQNVHPAQTQRLVEALIQANKDFELLVLPGQEHHYDFKHQMYFERHKREFFSRWLK